MQPPEMVPYLEECVLLRAVARALGLPLSVAATALAFLHAARRSGSPVALAPPELVCGCLYAAAKAEEVRTPERAHCRECFGPAAVCCAHNTCPFAAPVRA